MIKVCEVSKRYVMLFMHNNRYLPSTGLLTDLLYLLRKHREHFWKISRNISGQINHDIL